MTDSRKEKLERALTSVADAIYDIDVIADNATEIRDNLDVADMTLLDLIREEEKDD